MRTLRSSPTVSTSPVLTAWPGAFSRTPLMRTWPASTSAAALVRAFTTRACHSHLSRRWRSKRHHFEEGPAGRYSVFEREGYRFARERIKKEARTWVVQSEPDRLQGWSLRLAASCSFSAASLANGELGSAGRSRSRGAALVAYCRCDGPPSGRLSRAPLSRPPLSRPPLSRPPPNLPLSRSRSLPLPSKRGRGERSCSPRGAFVGAPSAPGVVASAGASGRDLRKSPLRRRRPRRSRFSPSPPSTAATADVAPSPERS